MENPYETYIAALKFELAKLGHGSQAKIAREIKVPPKYINDILAGRCKTSLDKQVKIAAALGLTYEDLLAEGRHILTGKGPANLHQIVASPTNQQTSPAREPKEQTDGKNSELNEKVARGEDITRKVLTSNTKFARALWENLKAFESAVDTEREMEDMREEMKGVKELLLEIRATQLENAVTPEKKEPKVIGST